MNIERLKRASCAVVALAILGTSLLGAPQAMAGGKGDTKHDNRRHDGQEYRRNEVECDLRRHEDERRAFVAGAVAQQHRDDYRDARGRDRLQHQQALTPAASRLSHPLHPTPKRQPA